MDILNETFPLSINPWISGIYAFYDPHRSRSTPEANGLVPAVLTAYCDEFGEASLMLHLLDYTEMTGGDIDWSHWTGIRWRGGNQVSLYGRPDEGWHVEFKMEVPLSTVEVMSMTVQRERFLYRTSVEASRIVAEVLLPHLPLVNRLHVWDGVSPLACPDGSLSNFIDEAFISFVSHREVVPLVQNLRITDPWYRLEKYTDEISRYSQLDCPFIEEMLREPRSKS